MYCKNCGSAIDQNAAVCTHCGVPVGQGTNYCGNCGTELQPGAAVCMSCGFSVNTSNTSSIPGAKSKIAAALLAFFLGGLGIHNFYLGYNGKAIAQLSVFLVCVLISVISCGFLAFVCFIPSIWALIDFILILCGSINTDANGVPLDN